MMEQLEVARIISILKDVVGDELSPDAELRADSSGFRRALAAAEIDLTVLNALEHRCDLAEDTTRLELVITATTADLRRTVAALAMEMAALRPRAMRGHNGDADAATWVDAYFETIADLAADGGDLARYRRLTSVSLGHPD